MPSASPAPVLPGPSALEVVASLPRLFTDALGLYAHWSTSYGEVTRVPILFAEYFINNAADVRHILIANQTNYRKTGSLNAAGELFGDGLITSHGALHQRQRKLIKPEMQGSRLAQFEGVIAEAAQEMMARWEEGDIVDMEKEMARLSLTILGRSLFSIDLSSQSREIHESVRCAQRYLVLSGLPEWLLPQRVRRYREAIRVLDKSVYRIIREHQDPGRDYRDFVSALLNARDEEGNPISEKQVRDEAVTFLLAGHETTATALTWTMSVLGRHPEIEQRMVDEMNAVLGGQIPTTDDFPKLEYTLRVISEVLRLYPPIWMLARRAVDSDVLPSGTPIDPGAEIVILPYGIHRIPEYFPDPERFDPDRFLPGKREQLPTGAYIPFGAGMRSCVGEPFALMEMLTILGAVLPRWRVKLLPGQSTKVELLIVMRPKHGLQVQLTQR